MRKIAKVPIFFIATSLFLIASPQNSFAEEYRAKYSRYSFLIPSGWMQIPGIAIIEQDSQRAQKAWKEKNVLITPAHREVFQKKSVQMFIKPYFTIYDLREGSWFIEHEVSKGMATVKEAVKLGKNVEDVYDKSRGVILYKSKDGEYAIRLLGRESAVELVFSPSLGTFEDDMETFNDVLNSLKFDKDYAFKEFK